MDIRFPEFPTLRETGAESVSRKGDIENSDFAEMLDRSLDEPKAKPREAVAEKPTSQRAVERDDKDAKPKDAAPARDTAEEPRQTTKADDPATTPPADEAHETEEGKVEAPAENGEAPAGDPVAATPTTPAEQNSAPAPTPIAAPVATPVAAPTAALVAANAPARGLAAAPQDTSQSQGLAAATPAPDTAAPIDGKAVPVVPQAAGKPAAPSDFSAELAAAAGKPAESSVEKPKSPAKSESKTAPTDGAAPTPESVQPQIAVAVPEAKATPDATTKAQRNPAAESAPTAQPPANPQQVVPAAVAAPQAAAETADDAQIVALVRSTNIPAGDRPANAKEGIERPAMPDGLTAKEPILDAKSVEPVKPEAPSRPAGAVAPGLSIAAQIAAQQQASGPSGAAENLAQVAGTPEVENIDKAAATGAETKTADVGTPASRTDQVGQIDASAPRHAATDVAAATAAGRARPPTHPMIAQIAAHVAQATADGNDRISIRLSPAELGRIDVKLEFGPDGRVQAVFAADRAQTVDLLQRDARDLERALQDAGLRADSGSLSFNLRGDGRHGAQDGRSGQSRRDDPVIEVNNPQLQAYTAAGGGSGRLDLRI